MSPSKVAVAAVLTAALGPAAVLFAGAEARPSRGAAPIAIGGPPTAAPAPETSPAADRAPGPARPRGQAIVPAIDRNAGTPRTAERTGQAMVAEPAHDEVPSWHDTPTGTSARLRGLAAVDRRTAWLAGSGGTVLRTTDGGRTWARVSPPDTAALDFRDIEALDARHSVVLAIGTGNASRMYRTADGGRTWRLVFQNQEPTAFYDCVSFSDRRHGLAVSDPVGGRFRILATRDGGRHWNVLPDGGMPPALEGETAFAASGQCLVTRGRHAWLASGTAARSRIFHSRDRGRTWTATDAPIPAGAPTKGAFALAFRDARHGVTVGGDYRAGQPSPEAAALTSDAGASWRAAVRPPAAFRSGVAWAGRTAIAVGPAGSDLSRDEGRTWRRIDDGSLDTVMCVARTCWAAGDKGRAARLTLR